MSNSDASADLRSTFVVVNRELQADTIAVTDSIWSDLDRKFGDFAGHKLIASFGFDDDWPTWEIHPNGDEVVCLMSGDTEMILATEEGEQSVPLDAPGSFVVVPKITWHTANVHASTTMLFVTPGEGTENRETRGEI